MDKIPNVLEPWVSLQGKIKESEIQTVISAHWSKLATNQIVEEHPTDDVVGARMRSLSMTL